MVVRIALGLLAVLVSALPALAAPATVGKVEGRAHVRSERTYGDRGHIHVGSEHVSVPRTDAGVSRFSVRMPWGGHVKVPGVHVRSPKVAVSSPRVDLDVPFHKKSSAKPRPQARHR
ncbi:MAG: hypothetical protein ACREM2_00580 [Vulcanimicrobiaceae bacterium]